MTPPIPKWSTSKKAGEISPTISALLRDAQRSAARNKPLYYCKFGFRVLASRARVHSFATARAAERRGLVITTGEAPHRVLHITGLGLDEVERLSRRSA